MTRRQAISAGCKLPAFENIPAKLSVTELKRRALEDENFDLINKIDIFSRKNYTYKRPNFLQKKTISGAEFGTIMHSVMQHLNFGGDLTRAGIIAQIENFVTLQILNPDQAEMVKRRVDAIYNFFGSDIGQKLIHAQEVYRELPFSFLIDAESTKLFNATEKILVQGIIDLLFKDDNNNWILIDYKTDKNNTDEHFKQEYHEQLKYYVHAVENIANIKISAQYLYLLGAGRFIQINC